jgi:hypothetical protein
VSDKGGAGLCAVSSKVTVTNSTFTRNDAVRLPQFFCSIRYCLCFMIISALVVVGAFLRQHISCATTMTQSLGMGGAMSMISTHLLLQHSRIVNNSVGCYSAYAQHGGRHSAAIDFRSYLQTQKKKKKKKNM